MRKDPSILRTPRTFAFRKCLRMVLKVCRRTENKHKITPKLGTFQLLPVAQRDNEGKYIISLLKAGPVAHTETSWADSTCDFLRLNQLLSC